MNGFQNHVAKAFHSHLAITRLSTVVACPGSDCSIGPNACCKALCEQGSLLVGKRQLVNSNRCLNTAGRPIGVLTAWASMRVCRQANQCIGNRPVSRQNECSRLCRRIHGYSVARDPPPEWSTGSLKADHDGQSTAVRVCCLQIDATT